RQGRRARRAHRRRPADQGGGGNSQGVAGIHPQPDRQLEEAGMSEAKLPQGTIHYRESGEGPPIVFVHGLLVDGRLWRKVTPLLDGDFRCIAPDLPLGSHLTPMNSDADLSPPGLARIVAGFLQALDLQDVTLVANDTGGAISQITAAQHPE